MESEIYPFLRFAAKTTYYIDEPVIAPDCRLLYVIEGTGRFRSGNQTLPLEPYVLLYYPYGVPYHIQSDIPHGLLFYTLNFDFSQKWADREVITPTPLNQPSPSCFPSIPAKLSAAFSDILYLPKAFWAEEELERIYREYLQQEHSHKLLQDSLLRVLLVETLRHREENGGALLVRKIKDAVRRNLTLNIRELATQLNYHPFYLNEVFKKHEQGTLHAYIIKQRLIAAKNQITTTDRSLEEIALACGFGSQAHLSTVFKRMYGITPGFLRRKI